MTIYHGIYEIKMCHDPLSDTIVFIVLKKGQKDGQNYTYNLTRTTTGIRWVQYNQGSEYCRFSRVILELRIVLEALDEIYKILYEFDNLPIHQD